MSLMFNVEKDAPQFSTHADKVKHRQFIEPGAVLLAVLEESVKTVRNSLRGYFSESVKTVFPAVP